MRISDWISDVCSSDLAAILRQLGAEHQPLLLRLLAARDFDVEAVGLAVGGDADHRARRRLRLRTARAADERDSQHQSETDHQRAHPHLPFPKNRTRYRRDE